MCELKETLCEGAEQMRGHNRLPTSKSRRVSSPEPSPHQSPVLLVS